jgi:hydrogenase maturation protein HypF
VTGLAPLRAFTPPERGALLRMLARRVNSPVTTSAGRLFDAAAALSDVRQEAHFEGQAAMELEFAVARDDGIPSYPVALREGPGASPHAPRWVVDWEPLVLALLADLEHHAPASIVSWRFHRALADAIVAVAERAGLERVALSGGCFQNACLTELAVRQLESAGFRPYWHQRVPPNDGGIALGQAAVAARVLQRKECHVPGRAR